MKAANESSGQPLGFPQTHLTLLSAAPLTNMLRISSSSARSACAAARCTFVSALQQPFSSFSSSAASTARPAGLPTFNDHRSNAEELVDSLPVIMVQKAVALCDGGGGATGHPVMYIRLDKREGASPTACKYCGLRYQMAPGGRE